MSKELGSLKYPLERVCLAQFPAGFEFGLLFTHIPRPVGAPEASRNSLRRERGRRAAGGGGEGSRTDPALSPCRSGSRTVGPSGASGRRRARRPTPRGCPSPGRCRPPTRSAPTWTPAPSPRTTPRSTRPGPPPPPRPPPPSRACRRRRAPPACRPAGRRWASAPSSEPPCSGTPPSSAPRSAGNSRLGVCVCLSVYPPPTHIQTHMTWDQGGDPGQAETHLLSLAGPA